MVENPTYYRGIVSLLYLLFLWILGSQIYMWSNFKESRRIHEEWETERVTKFELVSKIYLANSGRTIVTLRNPDTGKTYEHSDFRGDYKNYTPGKLSTWILRSLSITRIPKSLKYFRNGSSFS